MVVLRIVVQLEQNQHNLDHHDQNEQDSEIISPLVSRALLALELVHSAPSSSSITHVAQHSSVSF